MAWGTGLGQVAAWVFALLAVLGALAGESLAQLHPRPQCTFDNDCVEALVCSNGLCRLQCRPGVERDCLQGYACIFPGLDQRGWTGTAVPSVDVNIYARCLLPGSRYVLRLTPQGQWVSEIEPAADVWRRLTAGGTGFAQPSGSAARPSLGVAVAALPYFRGRDGALWVRTPDGREQPTTAGAISTAEVVSAGLPGGSALVFLRATDQTISMIECKTSACGRWVSLGGQLASAPTAALGADGSVVVRATGMDNRTWQNVVRDGKAGGWAPAP